MLWAVIKLYLAIGRSETLSALLDQRMIVVHIITFVVYLGSVAIFYIFYGLWDNVNASAENKVFVSWAFSNIFCALVQLVLIYLFWNLSKVSKSEEEENGSPTKESEPDDKRKSEAGNKDEPLVVESYSQYEGTEDDTSSVDNDINSNSEGDSQVEDMMMKRSKVMSAMRLQIEGGLLDVQVTKHQTDTVAPFGRIK